LWLTKRCAALRLAATAPSGGPTSPGLQVQDGGGLSSFVGELGASANTSPRTYVPLLDTEAFTLRNDAITHGVAHACCLPIGSLARFNVLILIQICLNVLKMKHTELQ